MGVSNSRARLARQRSFVHVAANLWGGAGTMVSTVAKTGTPWLDLAEKELGVLEGVGAADNPRILAYYRDADHPEIKHDATAWCAAFACAMLERAGFRSPRSLAARSFLQWGKCLEQPVAGCVVVLSRGDKSWEGHVGFVVEWDEDAVWVLGGNQGDKVSVARFPVERVLGYRVPVTADNSRTIAAAKAGAVSGTVSVASNTVVAAIPAPEALAQMAEAGNAFAGALGGLAQILPVIGIVTATITVVCAAVSFYARLDDIAKKGR